MQSGGSQTYTSVPSFHLVLEIQKPVFMLIWLALYQLSHLSSPNPLPTPLPIFETGSSLARRSTSLSLLPHCWDCHHTQLLMSVLGTEQGPSLVIAFLPEPPLQSLLVLLSSGISRFLHWFCQTLDTVPSSKSFSLRQRMNHYVSLTGHNTSVEYG